MRGVRTNEGLAILDLDLERRTLGLFANQSCLLLAPLDLLLLLLNAEALCLARTVLGELGVVLVVGLAPYRVRVAFLLVQLVQLSAECVALVKDLVSGRKGLVLFLFDLVELLLDGIVALRDGLGLGVVELLLVVVDLRLVELDRVFVGLESFDGLARTFELRDLVEGALLIRNLHVATLDLSLELPICQVITCIHDE